MRNIYELLNYHSLKLLLARDKLIMKDDFERGTGDFYGWDTWMTGGGELQHGWHIMTIESNEDASSGLEGDTAVNTFGAWYESIAEKEIELENYGEISFEHYIKNDPLKDGLPREGNILRFYIDEQLKLEVKGPSPWYRCEPIGITPGRHKLKFEYILPEDKNPYERKAVIDTITVYQARDVKCLITEYTPPKPVKGTSKTAILRGFTIYQEMTEADTNIEFSAVFEGLDYHDFILHASSIFYFVDEFGVCYRGLFDGEIEPKSIALSKQYITNLTMTAGQKTGVGFC